MAYEIEITPEGLRHLDRLPARVRAAVVEAILGTIAANPHRAGRPLRGELAGLFSARRGDFRVIYEIDEQTQTGAGAPGTASTHGLPPALKGRRWRTPGRPPG